MFTTFWARPKVQNASLSPRKPYHMATTWGWPVGPMVAMFIVRRPARNSSTSAGDILIWSRRDGMAAELLEGRGPEQLRGDRAVNAAQPSGDRLRPGGAAQLVDE